MTGIELIAAERQRQIDREGYSPEHDDGHQRGELAQAAAVLASLATFQIETGRTTAGKLYTCRRQWPWGEESFKASNFPIRNLEKAGALIAAEIDRLQRQAGDGNTR